MNFSSLAGTEGSRRSGLNVGLALVQNLMVSFPRFQPCKQWVSFASTSSILTRQQQNTVFPRCSSRKKKRRKKFQDAYLQAGPCTFGFWHQFKSGTWCSLEKSARTHRYYKIMFLKNVLIAASNSYNCSCIHQHFCYNTLIKH